MAIISAAALWAQELRAAVPEGTSLKKEWKQYDRLTREDLPVDEMSQLNAIMEKALARRLPVDFYEAADRYRDRRISRSWKERDAAGKEMKERILSFGMPVLTAYYYSREDAALLNDYVVDHADELSKSVTPAFYKYRPPVTEMASYLDFKDDLEYAAWLALPWNNDERIYKILEDRYASSYPESALLEYHKASSSSPVKQKMEDFSRKYQGRGAALLSEDWLLRDKVNGMIYSDTTTSKEFLALKDECVAFQAKVKETSRTEKWLRKGRLTAASDAISTLTGKSLTACIENNVVKVTFRNTPYADITLLKGKETVYKARVANPTCSFYVEDTVSHPLPPIEDGRYLLKLKAKDIDAVTVDYDKSSLSVASREYDGRQWIYVADFMSGRPVEKVDVTVRKSGEDEVIASARDIVIDGYTPLPESLAAAMKDDVSYSLTCSYRDGEGKLHKSREIPWDKDAGYAYSDGSQQVEKANVMLSCGAYKPGDTVKFKAVAYRGDIYSALRTFDAGETLKATMRSQRYTGDDDRSQELSLVTNEFGSVAGEFLIPDDAEGGYYWISVNCGKKALGSVLFRVDEYVLPTYSITLDDDKCFWFKGDTVTVRGTVKSYSGHALTSATLSYMCDKSAGFATIGSDGTFSFSFVPENSHSTCKIKVTDATGETCETSRSIVVRRDKDDTDFRLSGAAGGSRAQIDGSSRTDYTMVKDHDTKFSFMWSSDQYNGVVAAPVSYRVTHDGALVHEGEVQMGEQFTLGFTGKSGLLEIEAVTVLSDQEGERHETTRIFKVLYLADDADVIDAPVENFLKPLPGGDVKVQFGAGLGDVWAVAELWGCDHRLLRRENIHLTGGRGAAGSLKVLDWGYEEDWPEVVMLKLLYFRNGQCYRLSHSFSRPMKQLDMPVEFSRFQDNTLPGNGYVFAVRALPQSECLVAVYDASTDKINRNIWQTVALNRMPAFSPFERQECGSCDSERPIRILYKTAAASGVRIRGRANTFSADAVMEEAVSLQAATYSGASDMMVGYAPQMEEVSVEDVEVRSDFADILAFEPFLRTGDDGEASFRINTSDKLSTYHVSVYAHDKDMHNGALVRDMVVTVPVKLSVVQPRILFEGDRYVLHATVSNSSDEDLSGVFGIDAYDGESWKDAPVLSHAQGKAHVPANGSTELSLPIGKVPHCGSGVMGIKLAFACRNAEGRTVSDGMFVTVPVEVPAQEITEAHSALLKGDGDRKHLTDSLMAQFANGKKADTQTSEILIADQLREVLSQCSDTDAEDAVSLSSAVVFRMLAAHLKGESADAGNYARALLALQSSEGGFAWFKGMEASAHVTAVVLERLARLKALGIMPSEFTDEVVSSAVKYLDSKFFAAAKPSMWRPVLSGGQYFYVRSLYAEVPLGVKLTSQMKNDDRDYLTPSKDYAYGCVFYKARRIRTIANLQSSEAGVALAKAWGVKLLTSRRLDKTLEKDLASLMQYAVAHPSGGIFYPNAVMPWRGLMESELYAHSFICDLFRDIEKAYPENAQRASEISEGIRLWIMVQKETQKWAGDPAFAEAVSSVMDGSKALMDTRVLVLKRTVRLPFSQIRKAGNGMTLSTSYSVKRGDDWVEIKSGEVLPVGEKIRATYKLWSEENRSFVRLSVPRPGCLVPVEQRSGYGWWGCYRRVRATATEYYWEVFPEEKTTLTEDFYVSQEGTFTAPAAEVESAYAPHYRANTGAILPIHAELLN